MVCFDITLAYPLQQRAKNNLLQAKRMEQLRKYFNADLLGSDTRSGEVHMRFAVCDSDAACFLRDIPHPVYCVQINILRTDIVFYSNKKKTGLAVIPPRDTLLLKQVYWNASQLERRCIS